MINEGGDGHRSLDGQARVQPRQPMLHGEAVTLWREPAPDGDILCFVVDEMPGGAFWLGMQRGDYLVVSESLPKIEDVVDRAEELRFAVVSEREFH